MPQYRKDTSDCFGRALLDYYHGATRGPLLLHNNYGAPEEIPLEGYFYAPDELPEPDIFALSLCRGRVLDIGAAAGRHAIALHEMGLEVTALDSSGYCCALMQERGVANPVQADIFEFSEGQYDTVILLTNGIGLAGDLEGYGRLLGRLHNLVVEYGRVVFDSSDIMYIYEGEEPPTTQYYGIMPYRYTYGGMRGNTFNWLYIDAVAARKIALSLGWHFEVVYSDDTDAYIAVLTRMA
jgi:SAM-dependent methyltransferase